MKRLNVLLTIMAASTMILTNCSSPATESKEDSSILSSLEPSSDISSEEVSVTKLASPTGFNYEDGILSFSEVEGASRYEYIFKHNEEVLYQDELDVTSLDVEALDLEGSIDLVVIAKNDVSESDPASYHFVVLAHFDEVMFEAENYLYNFGTGKANSNFRNNPLASNGAYVGGLDDAGHGIYINYLCPFDGEFEIESHYCYQSTSEIKEARHEIWVNGEYDSEFNYTEETGWGGATFNPATTSTKIHLKKGWNTISIMKNGTSVDNWGDFAEIDYLVLKGNDEEYNPDDLASYGLEPTTYRLEAEMGSPRKKYPNGLYQCKNPCIVQDDDHRYSNGFLMGGVENKYDGVEWHFNSLLKAKYSIKLAYAAGMFEGCKPAMPSFVVTQEEVGLQKNVDFLDHEIKQMDALEYTGWNNVKEAEQTFELVLEQGDNFIYCLLLGDSGFFQIDYCDLTFIEEVL